MSSSISLEKECSTNSQNKAIDLSHHFSNKSNSRKPSPLGTLQYYLREYDKRQGVVNFALGMPDPSYFPFESISADAFVADSFPQTKPPETSFLKWFWSIFGSGSTQKTDRISVPKHAAQKGDIDLASALQYMGTTGIQQLLDFTREFTAKVYQPAYSDWKTLAHVGNKEGITRSIATLCDPGELILVEEWTYPSALSAAQSLGVLPAPVKIDGEGMSSVDLENVLCQWDEKARGAKRPHVLYTVPIGQNPTGATMGLARKKAIYAVCVKYDVIIIEDDPYYFLQEGTYVPKSKRTPTKVSPSQSKNEEDQTQFIKTLAPSFLSIDYQGRVIRLDSFSKILAPGSRLGWFTCNTAIAERIKQEGDSSVQTPSGFSQALITQLVSKHWGVNNLVRWLHGLRTQYTIRRDCFVDCIFDEFEVRQSADPALATIFGAALPVFTAYPKALESQVMQEKRDATKPKLFSFVPPSSGMFVWLKFHVKDKTGKDVSVDNKVFFDLADHGLLIAPGHYFGAQQWVNGTASSTVAGDMFFRLAFSMGKVEDMKPGIQILAKVLNKYIAA